MEDENVQIRQGDVLLEQISKLPKGLKQKDKILAYGETTGHKHQFVSELATVFEDKLRKQFVELKEQSILEHEEHTKIALPKGVYKVTIQREFDIVEGTRQVMD